MFLYVPYKWDMTYKTKNGGTMSTQQKTKKQVANATTLKLFNACKINQLRKEYSKQWIEIKEETLPIVEENQGFITFNHKSYTGSIELVKKNTTRFNIKDFKEKHPEIYESFLVGGESTELRTKYKRVKK